MGTTESLEHKVHPAIQVQLENVGPLVNEEHLGFKVYQVLQERLARLDNLDYLDLQVQQDLPVNLERLEKEDRPVNQVQQDRVVCQASEEPVVQKEKQESPAKTEKKGLLGLSVRLDNWVFPEKEVVMAVLEPKEMQVYLEVEVELELLEKLANPVVVGSPERMALKA